MPNQDLAEQVKAKLALEDENLSHKIQALKDLNTKALIEQIITTEQALDTALREEHTFKDLNAGFLSSVGSDCAEVKRLLAELSLSPKEAKMTAVEMAAWLITQRTKNTELTHAIGRQRSVTFQLGNLQINIEQFRRRLDGLHGVLHLRTAQVRFLCEVSYA